VRKLGTARDLVVPRGGLIVEADLTEINDELIKYLAQQAQRKCSMRLMSLPNLSACAKIAT
jgi:hypothetical protein